MCEMQIYLLHVYLMCEMGSYLMCEMSWYLLCEMSWYLMCEMSDVRHDSLVIRNNELCHTSVFSHITSHVAHEM